jgi:hypothetical protein
MGEFFEKLRCKKNSREFAKICGVDEKKWWSIYQRSYYLNHYGISKTFYIKFTLYRGFRFPRIIDRHTD